MKTVLLTALLLIIAISAEAADPLTSVFSTDNIERIKPNAFVDGAITCPASDQSATTLVNLQKDAERAKKSREEAKAEVIKAEASVATATTAYIQASLAATQAPADSALANGAKTAAAKLEEEKKKLNALASLENTASENLQSIENNIRSTQETKNACDLNSGIWERFTFEKEDRGIGGLSIAAIETSQKVKLNALNYWLWLGGDYKIPFQIFLSHTASTESTEEQRVETINSDALLDPESGIAVSVPFLWRYRGSGNKPCHFIKPQNVSNVGYCSFGGKIVGHFKNLETLGGESELASGVTAELVASALFPVFEATNDKEAGYLALHLRLLYAYTDIDDPFQLFIPLTNAEGEPITFDKSMGSFQLGTKLAINKKLAIGLTWTTPLDNKKYIDENLSISLETQF